MNGFEESERSARIEKQLQMFGMSKVLQLSPLTLQEAQTLSDLEEECSETEIAKKVLYIAAGYFSIGTELRLISAKSQLSAGDFRESKEFKLSELHHLFCIYLVLKHLPCRSLFLSQLLTSYNNHYNVDLELFSKSKISLKGGFEKHEKLSLLESQLMESSSMDYLNGSSIRFGNETVREKNIFREKTIFEGKHRKRKSSMYLGKKKPEKKKQSSFEKGVKDRKSQEKKKASLNSKRNMEEAKKASGKKEMKHLEVDLKEGGEGEKDKVKDKRKGRKGRESQKNMFEKYGLEACKLYKVKERKEQKSKGSEKSQRSIKSEKGKSKSTERKRERTEYAIEVKTSKKKMEKKKVK